MLECTVRLASIYQPQIEGEFTATPGGQTNIFYGCVGSLLVELGSPRNHKICHDITL